MPPPLTYRPVRVATGSDDEDGRLVLADGRLVAVLVHLAGEEHKELRGGWFLEAGFGCCAVPAPGVFPTIEDAEAWIGEQLSK
ncbi:MAG TPA: hypothetical protein VHJ78_13770 [Actinomycetota bacterium]|nr:hypothetical protein [Actinomycetota bacterium]